MSVVSGNDAISDRARHVDVVAALKPQRTEIGFDGPLAAMHEDQLVAIRVAIVERHGRGAPRNVQLHVVVAQERDRQPLGIAQIGRLQPVQIEAVRPQLAFETDPAGGRVRVIEMRALAVKALAPVLFLEGAFRQADVGLRGDFAFLERIHAHLLLSA